MTCYLVVDNETGVVVNAIAYDGEAPYEESGCYLIPQYDAPLGAWIGWTYIDDVWAPPSEPVAPE